MTYLMAKTTTSTIIISFRRKFVRYYITKLFYKIKGYEVEVVQE